jgi:hypothetical protein
MQSMLSVLWSALNADSQDVQQTSDSAMLHLTLYILHRHGISHPHVFRTLKLARSAITIGMADFELGDAFASTSSGPDDSALLDALVRLVDQYGDVFEGRAESRLGVQATVMLYEVCRVARLEPRELGNSIFLTDRRRY